MLVGRRTKVATLLVLFTLLLGGEVSAAEGAPGAQGHAFVARHRDDFALEVAFCSRPAALVDGEGAEAVVAGVCMFVRHDQSGGWEGAEYVHWLALLTTHAGVSLTPRYRTLPLCTM